MRTLVGVGVGPGDPELVTVKAVRVLDAAGLVLVPVLDLAEQGRAEATVRAHVGHGRIRRVVFAMAAAERREAAWDGAAAAVSAAFSSGVDTVAFATIGDPAVYSTFSYLAQTVREREAGVRIELVPGVTAMQDLAARSGTPLCEGTESLALLPLTAGLDAFDRAVSGFDTVVAYKGGRNLPAVLDLLRRRGRLDGAVYGAALGLPDQDVRPARDLPPGPGPYLSTLLVPALGRTRGGKL